MHYGVDLGPMGELWREAMQERGGGYSRRTADDDAERSFWREFMAAKGSYAQDEYAGPIAKEIANILGPEKYDSILELGPGWGNYTFDLARHCRRMRCVDISPDVLNYITGIGTEKGFAIETEVSKWEDYTGEPADVVFGYNCFYRMKDIEGCLAKFHQIGSKLHIMGMTSGPEQEYYLVLEKELGLEINYHRLDYIFLLNILYLQGIDCNVKIVPLVRDYAYGDFTSACNAVFGRILTESFDTKAAGEILAQYICREDDGRWHYRHHFRAAILYW